MFAGYRGLVVVLGLVLCAVFGAAFFVGSWLAYIAAVCAIGGAVACALFMPRPEDSIGRAVKFLEAGGTPEEVFGSDAKSAFQQSMARLGEIIGKTQVDMEFYAGAIKGAAYPAFTCGIDGKIHTVSEPLVAMLKKPVSQVIGFTVSQAFYNKSGDSLTEKALKSGKPVDVATELSLWDDRVVPVKVYINLIHDSAGEVVGAFGSFFDTADMAEQQKELDAQRENMAQAGKQLSALAEHVASATELLSASADDQAQGAQKQRGQTSSVATAMEQMTGTVLAVAQNAAATSEAADQANTSAAEGVSMVSNAVEAINEVADSAEQLGKEVGELDSQAEEIGRIISVINDIADQTNLLALNAAIEAARAGDAGRGFAVVADEVRKLAEKTVTATKEVEEAIGTIQNKSRHAMESMRQTEKQVTTSTELSNQAGEALQQIMESIQDMVGRVAQIATAAEEQSAAAEEINRSVDEIAEIASDADEAAGQAASATRDLAGLAQELLNVSRDFTQGGESRLRESKADMKGILPKLTQEFVQKTYGPDIYEGMQEELGHPVFLPTDSYPDQVLMQMAELVSFLAGISTRTFFLDLGRFTVVKFHEMYPSYFKEESLKDFYLRMNDVHAQLTKDQPGIKPPNFTYEDKGDDLFMNYRSQRGLFDYFEGILLGAADFKGERVTIEVKPFDETTARAEIVFHGK